MAGITSFEELKTQLDPGVPKQKNRFVAYANSVDPRTRVGQSSGGTRLTANRALRALGIK